MISAKSSGSTDNLERALRKLQRLDITPILHDAGKAGVTALEQATPRDTGLAAGSWGYHIRKTRRGISIVWTNSDVESNFPVAIMLQYGYATGTGGYVAGRDYINPAIRPIMDKIASDVWRAVTNA